MIMHDGGRNTAENAGWHSFGFDDDDAFFYEASVLVCALCLFVEYLVYVAVLIFFRV